MEPNYCSRDSCSLIRNIQLVLPLLLSQVFEGFAHGAPFIGTVTLLCSLTVGASWVEIWFLHLSKHRNSEGVAYVFISFYFSEC